MGRKPSDSQFATILPDFLVLCSGMPHPAICFEKIVPITLNRKAAVVATVDVSEKTSPAEQNQRGSRPRRQPQYQVILWNDDDHTYEYVINMLRAVFGFPLEKGYQMAHTVDQTGRVVCLVTTREHAELKQQQIHSFGKDCKVPLCSGAMWATIEPLVN